MKQPRWKRVLSHFYEFHIESVDSIHNPELHVTYKKGRYLLNSEHACYSYEDLYSNFYKSFSKINIGQQDVQNVLLLGFGLGSIPYMLENRFDRKYHYTAVELDEEVLALANKYAMPNIKSPIDFICVDAYIYVMQCFQKFDLIAVDIFVDDEVPKQFEQEDFLAQLKELLNPNGLILYNRLAASVKDKASTKKFYNEAFKPIFPEATYLDVNGNWMLMNRVV